MIVVKVAANTGSAMRRAAFSAASTGLSPRRARQSACSPTTIASSTTIPSVIIRANSEIILIVIPDRYIKAIAASIAVGTPAATQNAVRAFKNKNNSPTTSARPVNPFSSRIFNRPEIAAARVRISVTSTASGKLVCSSSATSSTTRWIAIASPPSERSIRTDMADFSPTKYRLSRSTPSTLMRATSPTVRLDPSGFERSTMARICSADRFATPVLTRVFEPATSPAGSASTSSAIALAICCIEIL